MTLLLGGAVCEIEINFGAKLQIQFLPAKTLVQPPYFLTAGETKKVVMRKVVVTIGDANMCCSKQNSCFATESRFSSFSQF